MNRELAQRFASRLQALEQSRDPEPLLELFADEVELRRSPQRRAYRGHDGARAFWREYLDLFEHVRTEFEALTESEGRAALEWRSSGRLRNGSHVDYEGCTVIEGPENRVINLRTYYDSASVLGHPPAGPP